MAIVQISKIVHRTGSVAEIPQLDVGEIGFASDEQRVFIGNDPAWVPPIGNEPTNTEILTNSPNCKIDFSQGTGTLEVPINQVKISGGTSGFVLATDGSGNLAWVDASAGASGNVTASIVTSTHNGTGTNFKVGDDAWIGDVNATNSISIRGVQDASKGYVIFGNADITSKLGRSGTGPLTYTGSFAATGTVTATTYNGDGSNLTGITGPAFSASNVITQTLTNLGSTILKYTSIVSGSSEDYDSSTGVFTPQKAGWYQINASFTPEYVSSTHDISCYLGLFKTNNLVAQGSAVWYKSSVTPSVGVVTASNVSKLVYLNGVDDFIGIAAIVTTPTGVWRSAASPTNYFEAVWIRP